jgi:hypothetical protein
MVLVEETLAKEVETEMAEEIMAKTEVLVINI